jgi:hypothetical protein
MQLAVKLEGIEPGIRYVLVPDKGPPVHLELRQEGGRQGSRLNTQPLYQTHVLEF